MNKDMKITVVNRDTGTVGYSIPELNIRRQFAPREAKEITFGELEALSFTPGGDVIIAECLVIKNEEAVKELIGAVEPEYFYSAADVKRILTTGTLNELLDCLDFAPTGVLEIVKELAVSLPCESIAKREAILKTLNFNVTRAIEIRDTKFDGETENKATEEPKKQRRTVAEPQNTGRRAATPKYKVVSEEEK